MDKNTGGRNLKVINSKFDKGSSWEQFRNKAINKNLKDEISEIEELATPETISFVWDQLVSLESLSRINELDLFLERQTELGGWVDRLLPPPFEKLDEVNFSENPSSYARVLLELLRKRDENLSAIRGLEEYPLEFSENRLIDHLDSSREKSFPSDWAINLDSSPIDSTLKLLDEENHPPRPEQIATLDANKEMLKHRKSLGYLPEPITGEDELAQLLSWAASKKPLDNVWKWLSPMNVFDLSDIFFSLDEYRKTVEQLKDNWNLVEREVFDTIYPYLEGQDITVEETFALTVGYGIRGWVTDSTFGINIEYVKDEFDSLLGTLAHELFHRIQPKLWPESSSGYGGSQSLEKLTSSFFEDDCDEKFYEVLAYISLEGTGELIRHKFSSSFGEEELLTKAKSGVDLLAQCHDEIYGHRDFEAAEKLLTEGLRSNGPFYSLGELMALELVDRLGKRIIGECLTEGAAGVFNNYLDLPDATLSFPHMVEDNIFNLNKKL